MLYVDEASGFFGGNAKAGNIRKHGLIRASLGVPVEFKPKDLQQVVKIYCYDCHRVHLAIEACK